MGGDGRTLIFVSGVTHIAIGARVWSGMKAQDCVAEGDFAGVIEKLSSGFASGGDMKFDMDGNDILKGFDDKGCNCRDEEG